MTRKLTYWYAAMLSDSNAYSIRARTRREAMAQIAATGRPDDFAKVVKVTVEYTDTLDLLTRALGEGGLGEEPFYASRVASLHEARALTQETRRGDA